MTTHTIRPWRRATAALLALLMAVGPLATPAYAQTLLADDPIGFRPKAPPNVVMTVDDSTSMLADFLPDFIISTVPNSGGVPGFCRDGTGYMNRACGFSGSVTSPQYIYSFTNIPFPTYADGNPPGPGNYANSSIPAMHDAWAPPMHNNALNRLYYDPAITYRPPKDAADAWYPNQTVPTTVPADPWGELKNINLTASVQMPLYCNSDYPLVPSSIPLTDLQLYRDHCRINGTDYSVAAIAPAKSDYQYPWQKSGAVPNDPKYFWRIGGSKTIYCDTTHAKFPKTCSGYTCTNPTKYVPPTSLPQTCVAGSNRMGCNPAVPTDYTPVGCNTDPRYGGAGPCTKGAECLACSCNNTRAIGRNGACRDAVTLTGGSGANCGCNNSPIGVPCSLGACPNYTPSGMGTCSDGTAPVPNCTAASGNCSLRLVDPVTKAVTAVSLSDDADNLGEVCRHNNRNYPGGPTFAPFTYPTGSFTSARSGGTAACQAIPDRVSVPRHYWKTSIEWCRARITTNDKWRGYGLNTGALGDCKSERDATYRWPRFYKYGVPKSDPAYGDNYNEGAFERVDLNPARAPFVHTFMRGTTPITISRTYAEEMQNYANWFAYYRTRLLSAKTVVSYAFSFLNDSTRVGFHTLSNIPPTSFVNVAPFDNPHKVQWYNQLFAINIPMGYDTPNMDAIVRIGELFKNGGSPTLIGATDPITLSCQRNYHLLFTDGMQNQIAPAPVAVGNKDNTVSIPFDLPLASPPLINGAVWGNLYREDTSAPIANALADYGMHYWSTDLRPAMNNNVLADVEDPATWQHVNFFALSLGTEGVLNANSVKTTETAIAGGLLKWPTPTGPTHQPTTGGVDDLWHSAVNGRGAFINAKTPQELAQGLIGVLTRIGNSKGTDAGATFGNPNLSPTNNYTYVASFDGSSGNVKKTRVNETTGAPVATAWDAAPALAVQLTPTIPMPTPWITNRRVVTVNGGPVPFLSGSLSAAQLATLGPDLAEQTRVIEYLRGKRADEGTDVGQFRVRSGMLGDVVHASPIPVGKPEWPYLDANDPGYSGFKAAFAGRPKRVYVASNDGMVHALNDVDGTEAWSYVPSDLFRGPPNDREGLVGLTYQVGGLPPYEHRFMVNATPRAVDVNIAGTWRTLLVGGMGKGGKMYYALDITDPASVTDEASAAAKVLWEFRHPDLGYTYGRPTVVKTRAFGWAVIVPSGYNNATGEGKVFVLNPANGTVLRTLSTGEGTPGAPAGLAHIAGYVKDFRNQTIEQLYGGDLLGNVWRFDLSDPIDGNWTVEKLAYLEASGRGQPVTTEPQIEVDISSGVDRWVFVGTGKLLDEVDLGDAQQQSMYAMRDGTHDAPNPIGAPLTRTDLQLVSDATGLGSGVIAARGWYDDVPAGTRIIAHPQATVGIVGYVATGLGVDPCEAGQPANVYVRAFGNGESVLEDSGGNIVESIYVPEGGAAIDIVAVHNPSCSGDCMPTIKMLVTTKFNSTLIPLRVRLPGQLQQHRMSWRLLGQ